MRSYEAILLAGPPGSGKTSIGNRVVELDNPSGVRHLDIGDLKRSIERGETPSAYAELLKQKEHPNRKTGAAPSEAMTGIVEEFFHAQPDGLIIVDGFPRYMDRVQPFQESMDRINVDVLALCVVAVEEEILLERLAAREQRTQQKLKDPHERLADHKANIVPTLQRLAEDYPLFVLDGVKPIEENAKQLVRIYQETSSII